MDGPSSLIYGYGIECYLAIEDGRILKRRKTDVGRWHTRQVGESHAERLVEGSKSVQIVSRDEWPENDGEYEPYG